MHDIESLLARARAELAAAGDLALLDAVRVRYLGKKGELTGLLKQLGALPDADRRAAGQVINAARDALETQLNERRSALEADALRDALATDAVDVSLPGRGQHAGGLHPVTQTRQRIEAIFAAAGFAVSEGPEVEDDFYNFTALNIPEDHPARSMHDTFYVEGGGQSVNEGAPNLLRTHTSPVQVRHALQHVKQHRALIEAGQSMPEIRVICPGRTYRVDSDATHSPMFHQCEGLWIGENVSFKDLKYVFTDLCRTFFERDDLVLRFRPSFFPFTEPSAEIDIQFQSGPLAGRWLEVAGSGQVHPTVVRNMGLDPEKYIGFAFGMGLDRFTMLRYGVNDLRLFFDGDIRFLSQFQ